MGTHRKRSAGTATLVLSLSLLAAAPASAYVLWPQSSSPGTGGTISQDYSVANALDSRAADDFIVPDGQTWRIEGVNVGGLYDPVGNASSVDVAFFQDAGSAPGELIASFPDIAPVAGLADPNFQLPLGSPLDLGPGSYWVAVQSNQGGLLNVWQWANHTRVDGTDGAVWQLINGGAGCIGWLLQGQTAPCGLPQLGPDLIFDLIGTVINTALPGLPGGGTGGGGSTGSGGSTGGSTGTQTAKDTRRPRLSLSVRRRQRLLRQRGVILRGRSDEAGTLVGKGTVTVPSRLARALKLTPAGLKVSANRMGTVKLRLSRRSLKSVKRAFGKRRTLTARVSMTAFDEAGNNTTVRRRIKLRR